MKRHRVAVTGVGLTSPIGESIDELSRSLREGRHGVRAMPEWAHVKGLEARIAAPVPAFELGEQPRKKVRSMGRVAQLALAASERALASAGLARAVMTTGRAGVAYGSTHGASEAMESFCKDLFGTYDLAGLAGTSYLRFMSHTCAANLAQFYGVRGRVLPTCAACVSGSLAVGAGYELVRDGVQDVMLCGGAEAMHFVHAAVFDLLMAASRNFNDRPEASPRPFDVRRDGIVVGEAACTLVLERYEHAVERGAHIFGELMGYGTTCDGTHVTAPSAEGMGAAMRLALEDAGISAGDVHYVNAHATGTELGDVAEAEATRAIFGAGVPVSSTKGHTGHTLGACGALETAVCLASLRDGFLPPTRNLEAIDPRCDGLDHVVGSARETSPEVVVNNNFAFGGINTSLVVKRAPATR